MRPQRTGTEAVESNIIDLLDDDERPPPTPIPLQPTTREGTDRTVDHDDDDGTEMSMELSTPLNSTVLLGETSLSVRQEEPAGEDVDLHVYVPQRPPVDVSSVHNGPDLPAVSPEDLSAEADGFHRERMERRIVQLEAELRAAREELSATDNSLKQLREFIEIVQLEMDNGDPTG